MKTLSIIALIFVTQLGIDTTLLACTDDSSLNWRRTAVGLSALSTIALSATELVYALKAQDSLSKREEKAHFHSGHVHDALTGTAVTSALTIFLTVASIAVAARDTCFDSSPLAAASGIMLLAVGTSLGSIAATGFAFGIERTYGHIDKYLKATLGLSIASFISTALTGYFWLELDR